MFPESGILNFEENVWSVSDLNAYIKELIDIDFRLQELQVSGEVSNFSQARSGHLYFTLKDENSQLRCVMWASAARRLRFLPNDGDAVLAKGRISVYEVMGTYQLYVEDLEPAGIGDLARAFELLKSRLSEEGLFDVEFKKAIPPIPSRIGIATSADAAALRDILTVLRRRWPLVSVLIAPTLVQGREAPQQIISAVKWLDGRQDVDTIIVARGGGSMEDLWAFNDEGVARTIFEAEHPIIVGVGHETDFTIADFVADLRAPTPSAAAELAVPDQDETVEFIRGLIEGAHSILLSYLNRLKVYLAGLQRSLRHLSPRSDLDKRRQQVDMLSNRMDRAFGVYLDRLVNRKESLHDRLLAMSPAATLERGYAIVKKHDGSIVRSVQNVDSGETIDIQVADGDFNATVD